MANILSERQHHERYCTGPLMAHYGKWGRPGDVRECDHGKLMLGFEVIGTIPPYWRTLHPIWTPVLYRRARKALA